jgi:hypothetical protein
MASRHGYEWWRPDALLPALVVIGPYFFNKLIYIEFPGYPVFVATDYACRIFRVSPSAVTQRADFAPHTLASRRAVSL